MLPALVQLIDDREGNPELVEDFREPFQTSDPIEVNQRRRVGDRVSHGRFRDPVQE